MQNIFYRNFTADDRPAMHALQEKCVQFCPDTTVFDPGFYLAPGFAAGKNIILAEDDQGTLLGYVWLYPAFISTHLEGARILSLDLRVDPDLDFRDNLRDILFNKIVARAREIKAESGEKVAISSTYFAAGLESIAFMKSKGLRNYINGYFMECDLTQPLPNPPQLEGVTVKFWRMETEAEQRRYIQAYDSAFQNNYWSVGDLQNFIRSSLWVKGGTLTAFAGEEIAGSVMVYFEADFAENQARKGFTEHVFVVPQWQKRGLARYLISQAQAFLKDQDLLIAALEVEADNRSALSLYESLGYNVVHTEVSLGKILE
jgi:ribosomal protein S18 acetylase RimI-like enzyme